MSPKRLSLWVFSLTLIPAAISAGEAPDITKIDFNRDVRPILAEHCFACHGPDKNKRKAELRLDTKDGLFAPPKKDASSPVVPGKPDESELIERITHEDADLRMPPAGKGKPLSVKQIETLRRWISEGAEWKGHWAYIAPVRHPVPATLAGETARNPIDPFILARLRESGLKPSPEADKASLLRRVSFDLTGLPPSAADVKAFEEDDRPDAYERVVDRLLASPHYGERMAAWWLDLVRFADTIGYHSDNPRNIWPYRDYVIASFNNGTRFDQFTREQIAGDLFSDNVMAKVASGYNHLLQTTEEGGAQAKEYAAKYAADRVRNVSTVWMGATMGCAECHDHKYDPILTKDFYRFEAFFADIYEPIVGKRDPGMPVPDAAGEAEIRRRDEVISQLKLAMFADSPERSLQEANWAANHREPIGWTVLEPESFGVEGESSLRKEPENVLKTFGKIAATESLVLSFRTEMNGITGFRLEALADPELPAGGPGASFDGTFFLTEFKVLSGSEKPGVNPTNVPLLAAVSDGAEDGREAEKAIDGQDGTGWSVYRGKPSDRVAVFETIAPLSEPGSGPQRITVRLEFRSKYPQKNLGKFRISATTAPAPATQWVPPVGSRSALGDSAESPSEIPDFSILSRHVARVFRRTSSNCVGREIENGLSGYDAHLHDRRLRHAASDAGLATRQLDERGGRDRRARNSWISDFGQRRSGIDPTGPGELDRVERQSFDRTCLRHSPVEIGVRNGLIQSAGRPRRTGRVADPPGTSRLAGRGIHGLGLGCARYRPVDRHVGHVSASLEGAA